MARKNCYQWDVNAGEADAAPPSRSQKKRDSTALQALGEELARLPVNELSSLPLTPDLDEALRLAAKITNHEGKRRQLQFVGRLMREMDVEALRATLEQRKQGHAMETAAFHKLERLRTALLGADETTLTTLLAPWPEHVEEARRLVEEARRERDAGTPPRASRELFALLRKLAE